jgi:CheY-like chemotaxis protein
MTFKFLRILVAEEQNVLRLRIEKSLGELGYRAVASARSLRDLLALTHYSYDPFELFDLMVINGELLAAAGIDPVRFFQSNPQIRHGVIHDARRDQPQAEVIYATHRRQLSLIRTPDRQTLGALLEQLDA